MKILLIVHNGIEDFIDRIQDVRTERSSVIFILLLTPLLGFRVEETLTPQSVH